MPNIGKVHSTPYLVCPTTPLQPHLVPRPSRMGNRGNRTLWTLLLEGLRPGSWQLSALRTRMRAHTHTPRDPVSQACSGNPILPFPTPSLEAFAPRQAFPHFGDRLSSLHSTPSRPLRPRLRIKGLSPGGTLVPEPVLTWQTGLHRLCRLTSTCPWSLVPRVCFHGTEGCTRAQITEALGAGHASFSPFLHHSLPCNAGQTA